MTNKQSYKISDSLVKFLIETANGFINAALLEELFSAIEKEAANYHFTSSSEANFIRIISAVFNGKLFLRELIQYPHHLEIVIAISATSNYLTDITVRNPEYLYQLFDQYYLSKPIASLSKEISYINAKFKSFNSKANMLRNLKSQCILKTGVRDILGFSSLEETVQQISMIAKTVLSSLFNNAYKYVLTKHKIKTTRRTYCLASLGKLGGQELNYSSDVDLILFFDKNTKLGKHRNIEYYELLTEAIQLFIKTASELTAHGFLYRIDFRLRPDGKNAPLSRTITDYERYYEMRGENWERQMLIKLDFLCGSKTLFKSFQNYIVHYVYPVSVSTSPIEQIKRMKFNIEKRANQNSDIKLFKGGIRDIEFGVQALQLLNGGKNKDLRTGNTLVAIASLHKYNLINDTESKILGESYIFYRKIEHFLQLLNDRQTHNIPEDNNTKFMLIRYLSMPTIRFFETTLADNRKNVRNIYDDIMGGNDSGNNSPQFNLELFEDKPRAKNNFLYLSAGMDLTGQNKFETKTAELFKLLMPKLQKLLVNSQHADRALENFTKFMRSVELTSIWYREFLNGKFLENIFLVCEYSDFSIELINSQKGLSEFILSRKVFAKNIDSSFDSLCPHSLIFILSIQYTLGLLSQSKLSLLLIKYIKFKINEITHSATIPTDYFIAGLGSFGAISMSFKSDIDLIFVVDNLTEYELIQSEFQFLLDKIKKELHIFEVDCRLRPEGSKSPLVWDLKSYEKYIKNRARVWEYQSLLKASFVCGNEKLFSKFWKSISGGISNLSIDIVRSEMNSMIKALRGKHNSIFHGTINIKNGWGSLTYINFIVSFMLIKNVGLANTLSTKSLIERIIYLSKYSAQKKIFSQLKENYIFLKNVELSLQNCLNKRNSILPKDEEELKLIANFLNIQDGKQLILKISKYTKSNFEIFNIILNETD